MKPDQPTNSTHILRNNLLGVLAAALLLGSLARSTQGNSTLIFAGIYGVQVLVNLILGFTHLGRQPAPYFLSALLVLLIGFGTCSFMLTQLIG
jgi:multicomponent K+:H+ antiporter subunit F